MTYGDDLMTLKDIEKNNVYPIVFIGSGISKRYLKKFPSWMELLEEFWNKVNADDFYKHLGFLRNKLKKEYKTDEELNFAVNTQVATEIEERFNNLYFDQEIIIKGLSSKDVYNKNISPFKYAVAQRFKKYEIKDEYRDNNSEIDSFKKFLSNAKMIITTNYDTFIEDILPEKPITYVGQNGFFQDTPGWSELFKIHGSVNDPNSIILNSKDFQDYDKHSVLINAKIIASMIDAPILFLGYSLTDRNVTSLLSSFSSQARIEDDFERITVIEYSKNTHNIVEGIERNSKGISYSSIETDNFQKIYDSISKIHEGLSPHEIMKFNMAIKKLIVTKGNAGALDAVLISPTDLDNVIDDIDKGKPIVAALGNDKNIYITPTPTDYLKDYIIEKFNIQPENALRFVARQQINGRYPLLHHYYNCNLEETSLEPFEKERINKRFNTDFNLEKLKSGLNPSHQIKNSDMDNLINSDLKLPKKIDELVYNCDSFNFEEFDKYVKNSALPEFIKEYKTRSKQYGSEKSSFRKLFVAWDILKFDEKK